MSTFKTPLDLRHIGERQFELTRPLIYEDSRGVLWEVPAWFKTDLASVPRAAWYLFPPSGDYAAAAVLHDYLTIMAPQFKLQQKVVDTLFLEAMKASGTSVLRRYPIYWSVRTFDVFRKTKLFPYYARALGWYQRTVPKWMRTVILYASFLSIVTAVVMRYFS
jgi:hypothetical protein